MQIAPAPAIFWPRCERQCKADWGTDVSAGAPARSRQQDSQDSQEEKMKDDPIRRKGLRPRYWERFALTNLSAPEWEALCDGCGKCCLNKLEDGDTGEVFLTRVACRLLDDVSCHCGQYDIRKQIVPECITLTPSTLEKHMSWMPQTCAYRLLYQGDKLPEWHPLLTGDPESVHQAGVSMRGCTVPEFEIDEDDWEDHIIEEPI